MKASWTLDRRGATRVAILLMALLAGVLALSAALPAWRQPLGTLLATASHAADPAPEPQATPAAAPEPAADTAAAAGKPWVFTPDPLDAVTHSLRERDRQLREREAELARAEARLEALRREVALNVARGEEVLAAMERIAGNADANRAKELKKWVGIYQAMKPQQAGTVMAGLDPEFALQVLSLMEPKGAGRILENMPPEQAIVLGQKLGLNHP